MFGHHLRSKFLSEASDESRIMASISSSFIFDSEILSVTSESQWNTG